MLTCSNYHHNNYKPKPSLILFLLLEYFIRSLTKKAQLNTITKNKIMYGLLFEASKVGDKLADIPEINEIASEPTKINIFPVIPYKTIIVRTIKQTMTNKTMAGLIKPKIKVGVNWPTTTLFDITSILNASFGETIRTKSVDNRESVIAKKFFLAIEIQSSKIKSTLIALP